MPELPEVETVVQELCNLGLTGERILSSQVSNRSTLKIPTLQRYETLISGQTIIKIDRLGKWIRNFLDQGLLLIHLGMTGRLSLTESQYERIRWNLSSHQALIFQDIRKFGRVLLVPKWSEDILKLGIDPFQEEFTKEYLRTLLMKSTRPIKAFLLDQKKIAGLGNIYVDEALFQAKIHPTKKANSLTLKQICTLHHAILDVLTQAISNRGTTLGYTKGNYLSLSGKRGANKNSLKVYQKNRQPCSECGNLILKVRFAGRGTHICTHCQKK